MSKELVDGVIAFIGGVGAATMILTPGYVLSKAFSRGVRGPELGERAFIATSAVGAILTHIMLLFWTIPLFKNLIARFPDFDASDYLSLLAWTAVAVFALPAFLGALLAWVSETSWPQLEAILQWFGVSAAQRTAEAWTSIFSRLSREGDGQWLQVRLRNGRSYLAAFGSRSFISSDARLRDIYLEQIWDLAESGRPVDEPTPNLGVWISGEEIASIEFYPYETKMAAASLRRTGVEAEREQGSTRSDQEGVSGRDSSGGGQ